MTVLTLLLTQYYLKSDHLEYVHNPHSIPPTAILKLVWWPRTVFYDSVSFTQHRLHTQA